jgi:cytochrome c
LIRSWKFRIIPVNVGKPAAFKENAMRQPSGPRTAWLVLIVLAAVQAACNFGAHGSAAANPSAVPAPTQPASATQGEHGSVDEALTMLKLAVAHYNSAGQKQALADFTGGVAPFKDRDLYVVCMNSSRIETANGGFPQYVGSSADLLKDVNGNPLGRTVLANASTTTINSVSYHWVNPVSGQTEPKTLYFEKVGSDVCGVGVYNP